MKTTLIKTHKINTAPSVAGATIGALLLSGKRVVSIEDDAKTK